MVAMRYTVTATRGSGPVWVFQCVEHPGAISEGRRLSDARRAAADLRAAGLTGADTAQVLGVSPQRVSQLVSS